MKLTFQDFEFDCQNLALSKQGRKISIKEKPATLLGLFLSDPQKIYSKAEILEHVWPGRTVTEQVVFQNIGHLRALFGDDAIKTFSKKGYQWQLPVQPAEPAEELPQPDETMEQSVSAPGQQSSGQEKEPPQRVPWKWLAPLAALVIGAGVVALVV
ncbi:MULTISPECIES: winged helix-turn-helix domain-containing protein [unclassified Pseudoalteromonas]|uniref:winged helix-turn-helix domain-containing protein n=1 Tax=unclassified Pseudoalteromonas TaxID=194690 RepID=UPI0020974F4F|nr:winged helix-turn-helix domain-containing protein [Pseudoalteromonas sp. XMcav2-N]MCO7186927.1 winged helix-turn-helix domain-containing protein [Pseudoalteromonas sp. XMcav2-N]